MSTYDPKNNPRNYEYRAEKFKRVGVDFEKKYYTNVLKRSATKNKMPVNTFIKRCIDYVITNKIKL